MHKYLDSGAIFVILHLYTTTMDLKQINMSFKWGLSALIQGVSKKIYINYLGITDIFPSFYEAQK